ncbi:hypothetical protein [Patulibacter defluvii]|uniref:hypothetical protein n=1 Tax=Patulibacter defluvii TaxID=3095358 RepID=UPI002A754AAC|nr:hypothetical protein [Patulibacter sp. DM4]
MTALLATHTAEPTPSVAPARRALRSLAALALAIAAGLAFAVPPLFLWLLEAVGEYDDGGTPAGTWVGAVLLGTAVGARLALMALGVATGRWRRDRRAVAAAVALAAGAGATLVGALLLQDALARPGGSIAATVVALALAVSAIAVLLAVLARATRRR